jgi:hypothetical protein
MDSATVAIRRFVPCSHRPPYRIRRRCQIDASSVAADSASRRHRQLHGMHVRAAVCARGLPERRASIPRARCARKAEPVSAVAVIPRCEECRKVWLPGSKEHLHAYWIDEETEDRLAFWCPECAQCEFGEEQ